MRKTRQFTPDEDEPLLVAWHRGDLSAFETLIWKYQKRIFNIALRLTGVEGAAAEAAENSFIAAYRDIRSLRAGVRFSTWLITITLSECRSLNDCRTEELVDTYTSINAAEELKDKLALNILALPPELAELVLLRYVRGYPIPRIAEIFQIREDAIEARLFKAEEELAAALHKLHSPSFGTHPKSAHPEIRIKFAAYLDNSADEVSKELVKTHLTSCGSCREALSELEWMAEHLRSIPDVEPPHWLATATMKRISSAPVESKAQKPQSPFKFQIAAALITLAVIGGLVFHLARKPAAPLESPKISAVTEKALPEKQPEPVTGRSLTTMLKGVFGGSATQPTSAPATQQPARIPLPAESRQPEAAPVLTTPPQKQTVTPALQPEQAPKPKTDLSSPPPQEWGDAPPQNRVPQKKSSVRPRGADLSVLLQVADPSAVSAEIEAAVVASGGKITGRAYSGGNDILYTRIDVERFLDLMGRLSRAGKIQELPEPPDGLDGGVELMIKWH